MLKYLYLLIINFFLFLNLTQGQELVDTSLDKLKEIQEINTQSRIKDSIRIAILNEELEKALHPNAKEFEQYREELLRIKHNDSIRLAKQKNEIEALRKKAEPGYVTIYNDTLLAIYTKMGPFNAYNRAQYTNDAIMELIKDPFYNSDSFNLQSQQELINIQYGNKVILSLNSNDALWEEITLDSLSIRYLNIITQRVDTFKNNNTTVNIVTRWGKAILLIVVFICIYKLIQYLFNKILNWLISKNNIIRKGLVIRKYELISPRYLIRYIIKFIGLVRILLIILITYIFLSIIFSIFPSTQNWANNLFHWVWDPLKEIGNAFINYLPNLFKIFVIVIVARFASRLLRFFSIEVERNILKIKGFHVEWAQPTYKILKILVYIFAFMLIFPLLPGAETAEFKGVSVFLGVLLSLGSTSAISNSIAGFIITYMRPFKKGDWIKVNDIVGEVIEKTALITRLRTINNEDVTVPNSTILSSHTINYSSSNESLGLYVTADIKVSYNTPWQQVHELLIVAAQKTSLIELNPQPYVLQQVLDEYYVKYQLNANTKRGDKMYFINSELNQNIQNVFKEAGIEMTTIHPLSVQSKP